MIKEFCSLVGWEHILVFNLKLCVLNWRKKTLVYPEISWSFILNYCYLEKPPGLNKGTPGMSKQVLSWTGMVGHLQPSFVCLYATFLWWISLCKKILNQNFPRWNICTVKQRVLMFFILEFFWKKAKNNFTFEPILGPFCQFKVKKEFFWNMCLFYFIVSKSLLVCKISEKN